MRCKTLVLATALAAVLPITASAFSMRCDDPGKRPSSPYSDIARRDFAGRQRRTLPEWLGERRGPSLSRPERPDWVQERRGRRAMPQRPELPEWVRARRDARPGFGPRPFRSMPLGDRPAGFESGPGRRWGLAGHSRPIGRLPWGRPGWGVPYRGHGPLMGRGDPHGAGDTGLGLGSDPRGGSAAWPAGYGYRGPWPLLPSVATPQSPASGPEPVAEPAPSPVDSDQDGVFNPADLCPESAAGAQVDAFGCEQNAAIVLRGVKFKTDSAELTDESLAILDGVSATLVANPNVRVEVAGHTDSDGDDAYNKDLSQRRSESVVAYLAGKGVQADNLSARGYGEEQPVADNATAEGRAENRRVELNRM